MEQLLIIRLFQQLVQQQVQHLPAIATPITQQHMLSKATALHPMETGKQHCLQARQHRLMLSMCGLRAGCYSETVSHQKRASVSWMPTCQGECIHCPEATGEKSDAGRQCQPCSNVCYDAMARHCLSSVLGQAALVLWLQLNSSSRQHGTDLLLSCAAWHRVGCWYGNHVRAMCKVVFRECNQICQSRTAVKCHCCGGVCKEHLIGTIPNLRCCVKTNVCDSVCFLYLCVGRNLARTPF